MGCGACRPKRLLDKIQHQFLRSLRRYIPIWTFASPKFLYGKISPVAPNPLYTNIIFFRFWPPGIAGWTIPRGVKPTRTLAPRNRVFPSWKSVKVFPLIVTRPKWYGQFPTPATAPFRSGSKAKCILFFVIEVDWIIIAIKLEYLGARYCTNVRVYLTPRGTTLCLARVTYEPITPTSPRLPQFPTVKQGGWARLVCSSGEALVWVSSRHYTAKSVPRNSWSGILFS